MSIRILKTIVWLCHEVNYFFVYCVYSRIKYSAETGSANSWPRLKTLSVMGLSLALPNVWFIVVQMWNCRLTYRCGIEYNSRRSARLLISSWKPFVTSFCCRCTFVFLRFSTSSWFIFVWTFFWIFLVSFCDELFISVTNQQLYIIRHSLFCIFWCKYLLVSLFE